MLMNYLLNVASKIWRGSLTMGVTNALPEGSLKELSLYIILGMSHIQNENPPSRTLQENAHE